MAVIDDIKSMLGLTEDSTQLSTIITLTESRLKALLGVDVVPQELEYIEVEIAVRRYNRIGSEGAISHSVEGESWSFKDNDFADFADDIQAWRDKQANESKGRIRFL